MTISAAASRLSLTLAFAGALTLTGCSAAASPSATVGTTPAATSPSASPTSAPVGLTATTEPADIAPAGAITISMSSFKFDPSATTATAGTVSFFLKNIGAGTDPLALQKHNLAIGPDQDHRLAASDEVAPGDAVVFTVQGLEAGTYVLWCTVRGHAGNGMVGTLTVGP